MDGYWIIKTIEVCNKLVAIVIVFEASSRALKRNITKVMNDK